MADHETTGTSGPVDESSADAAADADDAELDVEDTLMHQLATLEERTARVEDLAQSNAIWLAALEPRVEAVEQRVASQLELGQDYNRLDAQVSGLQAAFDELVSRAGPLTERQKETLDYIGGDAGEAKDPVVEFGPVEGSLATLESGTRVVLDGRKFVVVGPARETTVKVRPWPGRGEAQYLAASTVPDEVISE